jgi:DNA-binding transcriptional ArsR family regulator
MAQHHALDQRVVKALAHPLRVRLLARLRERIASPSELAVEVDEPIGNVSYHVRALADLGMIELVRTAPRRGALEHYYRVREEPGGAFLSCSELLLDARGWRELAELLGETQARAEHIAAESDQRLGADQARSRQADLVLMAFQGPRS